VLIYIPLFFSPLLYAQENKATVIADKATIYAEASDKSYAIESVRKGAVLTLFTLPKEETQWLYVTFYSKRYKGKATGFIKASMIALGEITPEEAPATVKKPEEAAPQPEEVTEKEPGELPSLKEAFAPKKAEVKKDKEIKPEEPSEEPVKKIPPVEEERPKKEEEAKEEILEEVPQAQVVTPPLAKMEKQEEFKRDEVFPKPEIKTTITPVDMDLPEHRSVLEPEAIETEELRAFAVIQRVMPPPPSRDVKAKADTAAEKPMEEEPFEIKGAEPETEEEVIEPQKEEAPPPLPVKVEEEKVEEIKGEAEEEPQVVKSPEQVVPPKDIIGQAAPSPKRSLLTMGCGYGVSLGGLGGFLQFNTTSGLSLHAGAGYYPAKAYYSQYDWLKNEVLYSVGIKYYLPMGIPKLQPYIDLQYGGISVEAVQVVSEIWYGDYRYENIQKTLYGPSLLGGVEFRAGVLGINAALGITYNTTDWEYWDQDLFLNGDFGVVIYF